MDQRLKKCTSIDTLFDLWKTAHQEEERASYLPKAIPITAFLPDGIISETHYQKAPRKVLFIAKEAYWYNNQTELDEHEEYKFEPMFWHREVAFGNVDETLFSKRLSLLANALFHNDYETINKDHTCLRSVAHMNLNKRGGYSGCIWTMLEDYTKRYAEYIAREVDLISPDLIICCGNGVHWLMEKYIVQHMAISPQMIVVSHPSYFALSDSNYLKQLQCAVGKQSWIPEAIEHSELMSTRTAKGILFDTNKTYSADALMDMLVNEKISAYEGAAKLVNRFEVGDFAFFYVKGRGVVAGGRIISPTATSDAFQGDKELYKMVQLLAPQKIPPFEDHLKALSPKQLKELFGHGFYYASTVKVPYLSYEESVLLINALKMLYES